LAEATLQHKTILHLTDYGAPYAGNFFASLSALERLLGERGDRAVYVLPARAKDRAWAQGMAASREIHFLQKGGFLAYYRQVRCLLIKAKADVLHEHFIHFSEKIAAWLAIKTCGHRVKTVLHLHNHIELPKNPLLRLPHMLYFRSVSRFVCCSESVAVHLVADGVPKERVRVAENAIAFARLDAFDPDLRATLKLGASHKLALMFGYNYEVKGVDLAVNAVRMLREREGMPATLAIVLSSRLDEVRARICAELNLPDVPDWILLLSPREDVASYYHMADVFLSPSRQEGFCYALVEAAYCKTPVLASNIAAQRDLALPKSAFFPSEDAAELSLALHRVLGEEHSPSRMLSLEQTATRVVETYSLSRWAERVCAAYEEIV
jgi:glycosyltransferase involved in cell wall biosynthesis